MMMMKWKGGGRRELGERANAMMNSYVPQEQKQRGQEAAGTTACGCCLVWQGHTKAPEPKAKVNIDTA